MMYRVLVTGSRWWSDEETIYKALDAELERAGKITLVHGACRSGADAIAQKWGEDRGPEKVIIERHPANWAKYGKYAGPIRNEEMVNAGADVCLAFPLRGSVGTVDCANRATSAEIYLKVFREEKGK